MFPRGYPSKYRPRLMLFNLVYLRSGDVAAELGTSVCIILMTSECYAPQSTIWNSQEPALQLTTSADHGAQRPVPRSFVWRRCETRHRCLQAVESHTYITYVEIRDVKSDDRKVRIRIFK
ncbi:hypothetical protein EVAR_96162_1 [Eumeta japonica]|uniref:Uncharacterized protein n=1 Tax=Eumeta variegata TaxID=151549 RepID=A0A4C1VIZ5_EUMVA|nr:hypothetical protein EVAR_96162_1 [Eumeta japonica]